MKCIYLFVYGTLRPACNHSMATFLAQRARLLGPARVQGRLYNLGWYPGLLSAAGSDDWVQGDLYKLLDAEPTLATLDGYETDASAQFERFVMPVFRDNGVQLDAWVYFYRGEVEE